MVSGMRRRIEAQIPFVRCDCEKEIIFKDRNFTDGDRNLHTSSATRDEMEHARKYAEYRSVVDMVTSAYGEDVCYMSPEEVVALAKNLRGGNYAAL